MARALERISVRPLELRSEDFKQVDLCHDFRLVVAIESGEPFIEHTGCGDFPHPVDDSL